MGVATAADWEEVKLIGRGAQGSVHLVKYKSSGEYQVVKKLALETLNDSESAAAQRECALLRTLSHPHIVTYVSSYMSDAVLHIVMELCARGDLSRHIAETKELNKFYPEMKILHWFAQICSGLEYMHSRRVLHRDLKSTNIFITKDDDLKLGDLGIAKILSSTMASARSVVGTPHYLSPELCESRPYSYSSDIWALGCVLYELCALQRPFSANNLLGVVYTIIKEEPPEWPDSPSRSVELRKLSAEMLAKKPEARPSLKQICSRVESTLRSLNRGGAVEAAISKKQEEEEEEECYSDDFESDDEKKRLKAAKKKVEPPAKVITPQQFRRRVVSIEEDTSSSSSSSPSVMEGELARRALENGARPWTGVPGGPPEKEIKRATTASSSETKQQAAARRLSAPRCSFAKPTPGESPKMPTKFVKARSKSVPDNIKMSTTSERKSVPFGHSAARAERRTASANGASMLLGEKKRTPLSASRRISPTDAKRNKAHQQCRFVESPPPPPPPPPPTSPPPPTEDPPPCFFADDEPQYRRRNKQQNRPPPPQREQAPPPQRKVSEKLRTALGERTYSVVYAKFNEAHLKGASVGKHELMEIVGSQDRYDLCLGVEQLVFTDAARR